MKLRCSSGATSPAVSTHWSSSRYFGEQSGAIRITLNQPDPNHAVLVTASLAPSVSQNIVEGYDDVSFPASPVPVPTPFEMVLLHRPESETEGTEPCVICLDDVWERSTVVLSCGHHFHPDCISKWLRRASAACCPICKTPVARAEPYGQESYVSSVFCIWSLSFSMAFPAGRAHESQHQRHFCTSISLTFRRACRPLSTTRR